jgi:hypothetical protein
MPNHVANNLSVWGQAEDVQMFKSMFFVDNTEKATYGLIFPMPEDLMGDYSPLPKRDGETDKQYQTRMKRYKKLYGADNWYDWSVSNWGTKWDVYDLYVEEDNDEMLNVSFSSAWSPPIGWFQKAVEMFPTLHFTMDFIEDGDHYCGLAIGAYGEFLVKETDVEYQDEDGNKVKWDRDKMCWMSGSEVLDEDFYPTRINPLL